MCVRSVDVLHAGEAVHCFIPPVKGRKIQPRDGLVFVGEKLALVLVGQVGDERSDTVVKGSAGDCTTWAWG